MWLKLGKSIQKSLGYFYTFNKFHREQLGQVERKCGALSGELEEAQCLLETAVRAEKQVNQDLVDTKDQVDEMNAINNELNQTKRKLEMEIHSMQV